MHFISNGDYGFPFESAFYWMKYFFIWSFQNGAANPDGIIRIPSALLNALVFQAFGNVVVGYFYIFLVFCICFASFYTFARSFIGTHSKAVAAVGALFFAINPIFLGNLAKVGLTLAVAMLPLLLVCIKNAFDTGRFRYLLIAVLLVNISLVHPFTCAVNVGFALGYLGYRMWKSRRQKVFNLKRFVLLGTAAIAINLYFILPIINLGTVSKDVISQDVTATKTNYTDLVDVANTGDMLTSMGLSRNVLKDFEFYNSRYESIYILAIFSLYTVLFATYIYRRSGWSGQDQQRFLISTTGLLGLMLLATGTFLNIDRIIKFVIGLPGGWMFRSPLKWQLYIPIFLFAALVIVLKNVRNIKVQQNLLAALLGLLVLLNGFMLGDVYHKMLVPRSVEHFAGLQQTNLDGKSVLYINSNECNIFSRQHPEVQTELRQVVKSQNVQFKTTNVSALNDTKLKDYDYLMGCQEDVAMAAKGTPFKKKFMSADKIATYENYLSTPYIYAATDVFAIDKPTNSNPKQLFAHEKLRTDFNFIAHDPDAKGTRQFTEIFENLTRKDIKNGTIERTLPATQKNRDLYVQGPARLYQKQGNTATLSVSEGQPQTQADQKLTVAPDISKVAYKDPAFTYKNVLTNGSLENGLWRKQVGDCSAYDRNARIAMSLNKQDRTEGKQSLQLDTSGHIACTGPKALNVQSGERYLVSFDYKNANKTAAAGYNVGFNDQDETSENERLTTNDDGWKSFDKVVTVPPGATSLGLTLYAYPDVTSSLRSIALYDDISVIKVPAIENNYYLVEDAASSQAKEPVIQFASPNPTKKRVHVQQASDPFYVAMKDGYSNRWVASVIGAHGSGKLLADGHVRLNTAMNGWYIDAKALCQQGGCYQNPDGSYSFDMIIEYTPQKWFVIGGGISIVAWIACITYIVRDIRLERRLERWPRQRRRGA